MNAYLSIGNEVTTNNGCKGVITDIKQPVDINHCAAITMTVTHKYDFTKIAGKVAGWVEIMPFTKTLNERFINI